MHVLPFGRKQDAASDGGTDATRPALTAGVRRGFPTRPGLASYAVAVSVGRSRRRADARRRHDSTVTRRHSHGLQGRRPLPGRLRPHRDHARRARDARPDGDARALRRRQAAGRRPDRRLAAHDDPDRASSSRPWSRSAPRCAGRPATSSPPRTTPPPRSPSAPTAPSTTPPGVPVFAWKGETLEEYWWCTQQILHWPEGTVRQHDPRRRRRRDPARPPRRRVGEDRRRARPGHAPTATSRRSSSRSSTPRSPRATTAGPRSPTRSRASPRRPPPVCSASTT